MIFNQKIAKKTISIKYSLIKSAKPIRRSFLDQEEPKDNFPLYFEVLHNKKLNRRSSLFYTFARNLKGCKVHCFPDHYVNNDLFNGQKEGELISRPVSDLVFLEKTHIWLVIKMTENWEEDSYKFKNFAKIYELSTVFAFDIVDDYFLKNKFLPILEKYTSLSLDSEFTLLNYLKENISSLEFFELVNYFLKCSNNDLVKEFMSECESFRGLHNEFQGLLTAEIKNTSMTSGDAILDLNFRYVENLATLPSWFAGSTKQNLISYFENHPLKLEALHVIDLLDEKFVAGQKEIISLFKSPS